ncbi:response regulator transcription factor [Taibaiella chishuiensis]|uniref:LuxR family two component transcriptional regulator n=1 Tax=Taibaiella chishuiensis TaxID=1434707 RepID=A0A2P8DAE7_9BACT|nr:response regulator transcription factor [Taibaiella chishuiensis]PSK94200.1 LuxR family two component transcriptional regulator [Taibaiella chishuiensis]
MLNIGLVDDHTLFRKGIISLIQMACTQPVQILFEAGSGLELQEMISQDRMPDVIIMDINMPDMNGFDSVLWLKETYPGIPVLVLTMMDKEEYIIRMLKLGIRGYLSKDVEPKELGEAITAVSGNGYYYTDFITGRLISTLQQYDEHGRNLSPLNERETEFLRLACSEYTYHEIAGMMHLSPKTVDGYRKALFEKLSVKNRVGLALYAVKHGIVEL